MSKEKEIIKSTDGKNEYPVDFLKDFFINSEKTIEELAIQLNLPTIEVQKKAREGIQSWYKLKQDKLSVRLKYFMDINIDNLVETHSVLEDSHLLTLIQLKDTQNFLKHYYAQHGHLFMIRNDGELILDPAGMPIPLPIPNGPKHLMALEGLLKLKEITKQSMNHLHEITQKNDKPEVVDVDGYGLFEEKD